MDELIISYKHRNDWYVGEIHKFIHNKFVETYPKIKFKFIENDEFKFKYNIGDYQGSYPSILNQYNLIITNPKNNSTFVNSLNDFAPFCLYPGSGVEFFDVKKFGFSSNFEENLLPPIQKYNPTPSFYILENFSDLDRVTKYRNESRIFNKAHFLGLIYGKRETYKKIFQNSEIIEIQSKSENEYYKSKEDYFKLISKYKMSLSIDGAAKICHRDIECLGVGNLLVRETLEVNLNKNLIPNIHYLEILNSSEKNLISCHDDSSSKYYKKLIEERILEVISNKQKTNEIISSGVDWFEKNCRPSSQFDLINDFTENLNIFF